MKINTALILCAGFGKRLNPLTLDTPKPLIELNNVSVLETCINLIESLDVKEIFINTFYLKDNLIIKNNERKFIYTGCQILNKKLLSIYKTEKFSINNLWNDLIEKKELYGFETNNDFYHLTDLKTFKKLQDL